MKNKVIAELKVSSNNCLFDAKGKVFECRLIFVRSCPGSGNRVDCD